MDTAGLTMNPETCPDCAKALTNESEGFTEGNETPGDSDSDGVYELSQDFHHRDRRDSRQPRKKRRRLGKTAAKVVHFWRLVCDTFKKIVDSKYFGRGIMIAILINTLSMGIEYHEQGNPEQRHCTDPLQNQELKRRTCDGVCTMGKRLRERRSAADRLL
ncbi:hypothetical protein XENOCAPTIV_026896 [Xenoophorus captivus]|uniref:Uncharacterized protein n=1 Tax=Xenoophorus captivus TaxID=1517983 RepID=A0ABV0SCQ4_9TELE